MKQSSPFRNRRQKSGVLSSVAFQLIKEVLQHSRSVGAGFSRLGMDQSYGGGSWMMVSTQNPPLTAPTQDLSHHQQSQQHHHQSLASEFHLLHLIEKLAGAVESGTRDQHSDALVNELSNRFDKCQQLLNYISGSINTKTVEGQKHKVEESEQLLNQRRELIAKYRGSVEEILKSDYHQ